MRPVRTKLVYSKRSEHEPVLQMILSIKGVHSDLHSRKVPWGRVEETSAGRWG